MQFASPGLEGNRSTAETMMPCANASDLSKAFCQQ
jgi:hypothetical protein